VKRKIWPVEATFRGAVQISDVAVPESYRKSGSGKGGVAGFAFGSPEVTLAETEVGTMLSYIAHAMLGGKLAQFGSSLIDGVTKKLADKFFDRSKAELEETERDSGTT
jgi:carbon monoxide dehydrogenase subunit G